MFVFSNIENILAYSCAPCFSDLKPANLVSLSVKEYRQISLIDNDFLESRGFFIKILCGCKKRVQVLIYNKEIMEKFLFKTEVTLALNFFGYPTGISIDENLNILAGRMQTALAENICKKQHTFPHEIGLFLGYPVYDVLAYYKTKGKGCLFSGYWKVYSEAEKAKRIFSQYNECKKRFALQIEKGLRLYDLLSA